MFPFLAYPLIFADDLHAFDHGLYSLTKSQAEGQPAYVYREMQVPCIDAEVCRP